MDMPFLTNRWRFGQFTIDLLYLVGRLGRLYFQVNILKALLFIELRKYEGHALGLSLKDKYKQVTEKRV